tara:strand:+ start:948 stop:1295 length:348 start_codon:yes stop_codon:yes gene_type:complete
MKVFLLSLLVSLGGVLAEPPPIPQLITFSDRDEFVFGMWWVSAGSEYNYILEVNEDDGWGWFEVAIWESPPKGAVMSGYTVTSGNAIGRVRVDRVEAQPSPRGVINWKVLTPVRF